MAGGVHISEEAAVLDLPSLVDRALTGERIVVRRDGRDLVVLEPVRAEEPLRVTGDTLAEVVERLRQRKASHGLTRVDAEFADDLEMARSEWNASLEQGLRLWD